MGARRQLPPVGELKKMRDSGMLLREIAEKVTEDTGERVTAAAVSVALSRAGLTEPVRYDELIPWRVQMQHQKHWVIRLLRLESRRRQGLPLEPGQERRLNAFLEELREKNAVVHYDARREPGFHFALRREGIDTDIIRVPDEVLAA